MPTAIAAGKKVYAATAWPATGRRAKETARRRNLNPKPHDLSDEAVGKQSDGALFWKLTEGSKPMPSYDKTLSETERWQVINYVRTLGKQ